MWSKHVAIRLAGRCIQNRWSGTPTLGQQLTTRNYHSRSGVYGYKPPEKSNDDSIAVSEEVQQARNRNPNLFRLIEAYRRYGHVRANLDPLGISSKEPVPELAASYYGLDEIHELSELLPGSKSASCMNEIVEQLEHLYCGSLGVEFMHIESLEEREWFAREFESIATEDLDAATQKEIAKLMLISQNFDHFVASKFPTVKRYGGEGAESCTPFYNEIFKLAGNSNTRHVYVCMAHRGRLNLLTGMLNFPLDMMFAKMKGANELPPGTKGIGDVLSHLTSVTQLSEGDDPLTVTLLPNPSHLEAANPFAVGRARVEQQLLKDGDYRAESDFKDQVVCLQIHGDAAISGQGVVQETLAFSQVPHFNIGGSLHLIVNNQVGYTTPPDRGRSSRYCSDVAKSIGVPVIHVNGDDPEAVVKAARLAWNYRRQFHRDVFVDVLCFRKWGHNELDDPTFTNPLMYTSIRARDYSVPDAYRRKLTEQGILDDGEMQQLLSQHTSEMSQAFKEADASTPAKRSAKFSQVGEAQAKDLKTAGENVTRWDTGVDLDVLRWIGLRSVQIPSGFSLHPTLQRGHVDARLNRLKSGSQLDWSTAETLALGSLMYQGFNVRISGQDVGRGTFSQRHCMLVDQATNEMHIPLNDLQCPEQQGFLEVANSILSEEAVLAFEYGMSVGRPDLLAIWEAQFGDFFNGAQIIIDTFVSSGEAKWQLQSGLVMLLPHGFDGAGPEHSSCRIERFLQLTDSRENAVDGDDVNMQVVNPTTPAQIFHLLRRQMIRPYRKPLIVAGPKTLLRYPAAVSSIHELGPGTSFSPVLDDPRVADAERIDKILFVSGKHYYALVEHRDQLNLKNVAVVRLEQLCPFPTLDLQKILAKYGKAKEVIWCQEEPRNGGAWSFVEPRFRQLAATSLKYSGRPPSAAPAVGISSAHKVEAAKLIKDIFP